MPINGLYIVFLCLFPAVPQSSCLLWVSEVLLSLEVIDFGPLVDFYCLLY